MIKNKESSFIVKGFCVRTIFSQNQLQNPAIIAYLDFYCSLSIVIVMTVISNFSTNLNDSLMIYTFVESLSFLTTRVR